MLACIYVLKPIHKGHQPSSPDVHIHSRKLVDPVRLNAGPNSQAKPNKDAGCSTSRKDKHRRHDYR